jgi:hypothetical protein
MTDPDNIIQFGSGEGASDGGGPLDATTQITDLPRRTTGDPEQRVRAAAPTQADRFSPQSGKAPEITTPSQRWTSARAFPVGDQRDAANVRENLREKG